MSDNEHIVPFITETNKNCKIFMAHGLDDYILAFHEAEKSCRFLKKHGFTATVNQLVIESAFPLSPP